MVVVPLASGQSVTVSMRSVTWPTGEGQAALRSTPEDLNQAAGGSGPGGVTRREEIAQAILAWFHDGSTTEWPGEIDAYRSLAGHLLAAGGLGADRGSRFRWAEEAAEADVRAVSEQARANVLAWLHAEAAWKRDQFRDSAVMYAARVAELNAELAGLRERAAEVQKYWRDWPSERRAKVHALSRFLAFAIEDLAVTVESWRAAPSGWPCRCGTDETDMVHTAERCYSATEPVATPVSTNAPVSLERDPDVPSSVEAPQPDANAGVPCFIISGPMLEDDPIRWLRCSRDKGHPGEHSHIEDRQDGEITWGWLHSLESPYRADYVDGRNNPHRPRDTDGPSEDGIGVWRQDDPEDGGYIFRKTGLVDRPDGPWLSPYTGEYRTNEEMRGCRRIRVTFAPVVEHPARDGEH